MRFDPGVALRRALHLISYWSEHSGRVVANYARDAFQRPVDEGDVALLDRLDEWTTVETVIREFASRFPDIEERARALLDAGFLEASNRPISQAARALNRWNGWRPAAAFFHFATKDVKTVDSRDAREVKPRIVSDLSYPDPLKRYEDGAVVELEPIGELGDLRRALRDRRTWRRFGEAAPSFAQVSTLLGITWGVRKWLHIDDYVMPLKTAPSGGARHSIEVYLIANNVDELAAGTYHYDPDRHALTALNTEGPAEALPRLIRQSAYHDTPALFVMTSVFERVQWRYRGPRAYRVILIEAGHLGQTFALVATSLGLAPFTTAAFTDSAIESHLAIDGVSEAPVYIVGVGTRPEGIAWAPYEWTRRVPPLTEPTSATRGGLA